MIRHQRISIYIIIACVPTANLFFKWAYDRPRIPAASTRRRRTIRKYRKKKDPNSTVDTVDTTATGDTYINYDAEWSKGDTVHSDWSRTESLRPLTRVRTPQTHPEFEPEPAEPMAIYKRTDEILDSKDLGFPPPRRQQSIETKNSLQPHRMSSAAPRRSSPSLRETEENPEEEEDNFYEMLVPSDAFFPWGTGLRPRPPIRMSYADESHELQSV